jgi:F-type H+-transporting ATPase subunit b
MNINFTLVSQAVAFLVFILFTAKFVWPPLMNAIEERRKTIAEGLAAASEGKASLEEAHKKVAAGLALSRSDNQIRIAEAEKQGAALIEQAKKDAEAERARILAQAKAEAAQEMQRAKEQLRNAVAELAVQGAAQILKREVNAQAHADLLGALKAQL